MNFNSTFRGMDQKERMIFPEFSEERIMMMPVKLGSTDGIP